MFNFILRSQQSMFVGMLNVLLCSFNNIDNKIVFHNQLGGLIVGKYAQCVMFSHKSPERITLRPLFQTTSFPGNKNRIA